MFPPSTGTRADAPTDAELSREALGWENWPSASEEAEELSKLVRAAEQSGFCRLVRDEETVRAELGQVFLNKLGVIVKHKAGIKKGRIIWDLRESKVNQRCDQAERVILPRLLDVVQDSLHLIRENEDPILVAVDIQDAFHNIPAGADKRYTVAAADVDGVRQFIIYDVLVFGSRSSPTIWGRYAAFLGRTLAAVVPEQRSQVYVDDPILVIPNSAPGKAVRTLSAALIWMALAGYPVKLAKAKAGRAVEWIGAMVSIQPGRAVRVSIPKEKLEALKEQTAGFLAGSVIGVRQLRSYAGGLSFVAGLVPVLRPFLAPLWSALAESASEGGEGRRTTFKSRTARQLIHTKRIAVALRRNGEGLRGGDHHLGHGHSHRRMSVGHGRRAIQGQCSLAVVRISAHRGRPHKVPGREGRARLQHVMGGPGPAHRVPPVAPKGGTPSELDGPVRQRGGGEDALEPGHEVRAAGSDSKGRPRPGLPKLCVVRTPARAGHRKRGARCTQLTVGPRARTFSSTGQGRTGLSASPRHDLLALQLEKECARAARP